jgi:hypothetical protein
MSIYIWNSDDFVFETEDSSLEPSPFHNNALYHILNQCEDEHPLKIDKDSEQVRNMERWQQQRDDMNYHQKTGAVSCDPTPIGSSIHVVGAWHPDYANILALLRPVSHRQQPTIEKPVLSSCYKSLEEDEQDPSTPQRYTSPIQGAGLNLTPSDQWNDRFQELADFRQRYGHSLAPHSHPESPSLSLWVKRQRYQYKLYKAGKHCTMTEEREAALEQLDFVWDYHAATWHERFSELIAFQSEYGHCKVPTSFPPNPQLAVWVKSQRRQFKLFVSGRKSSMTKERRTQLSSLGFVFIPRNLK